MASFTLLLSRSIIETRLSITLVSMMISRVNPGVLSLGSKNSLNSANRCSVCNARAVTVI